MHQDKQWQRISWNILSNLEQLLVHKYFSYSRGGKLLIISFILSKFKILPTLPAYRTSSTVPHPSSNGYVRLRNCIDPDASISPPSVAWQLFNKSSIYTRNQTNEQKHNRFALKQSLTRLHLSLLACSLMIKEQVFLCRKSASRKLMILGHFRYLMPFNYLSYEQS
jgi:hypothetical protein